MKLRDYLKLPVIVGNLPYQILNGQLEDAVPVMANFNYLVQQVNANVPPLIPTSSQILTYVQAANVGGSANAITLAPTTPIVAYAAGQSFRFAAKATNTTAVTVSVSGLAAQAITEASGVALDTTDMVIGGVYDICYDGAKFQLTNASQGSGRTAFTPAIKFGGASVGVTYSTQYGGYIKVQDLVFFDIQLVLSNKGSSVGAATITNMPFVCNAVTPVSSLVTVFTQNVSFTNNITGGMLTGTNTLFLAESVSGAPATLTTNALCSNTSDIIVSGFYTT